MVTHYRQHQFVAVRMCLVYTFSICFVIITTAFFWSFLGMEADEEGK